MYHPHNIFSKWDDCSLRDQSIPISNAIGQYYFICDRLCSQINGDDDNANNEEVYSPRRQHDNRYKTTG